MNSFLRIAKALSSEIVALVMVQFLFGVVSLSAQSPPAKRRQTIGLALQGGGALGLAHVGVITWLEEHHIPVDYVAGTSMGGLVGGRSPPDVTAPNFINSWTASRGTK